MRFALLLPALLLAPPASPPPAAEISPESAAHGPGPVPAVAEALPPSGARSPRNANYTMKVRLDPEAKTVMGTQVLRWRNISEHPTAELQYHLYYNAWRDGDSSWWSSGLRDRDELSRVPDDGWAYQQIDAIALRRADASPVDLLAGAEFIAPDDANPDDRTVLRVPLPGPVAPGEEIEVELAWTSKVPRTFARTGFRGDYFLLAQWFPKVGVLQDTGWNCHQFIQTEFFADFGVYDVAITVPRGWVVGATGQAVEVTDADNGTTTRFVQDDVHDFAWTTSPHFSVHEATFEYDGLPTVEMRLLLMPDHADMRDRYFDATRWALEYYGKWWGAYPYAHVTIVDPAWESGTGGMEYPTLFTGGTRWLSPKARRSPEGVTVHEAGHQFWYGVVANNEFEHAWLDEGFNTYSTTRTLEAAMPEHYLVERYFEDFLPVVFDDIVPVERTAGADRHAGPRSDLLRDAQATPSYRTGPSGYHVNAYDKGALTLRSLENFLGWDSFQRVMSTYYRTYAFRHPEPDDFFAVAERVSGVELDWYFDQTWRQNVTFDYAVDRVVSTPVASGLGPGSGEASETMRSHVYVRRWGQGQYPVAVAVTFEDGTRRIEHWDGREPWTHLTFTRDSAVQRVEVDPDHQLVLDVDFSNNTWLQRSQANVAALKWSSKWMVWVQHTMEAMAMFS